MRAAEREASRTRAALRLAHADVEAGKWEGVRCGGEGEQHHARRGLGGSRRCRRGRRGRRGVGCESAAKASATAADEAASAADAAAMSAAAESADASGGRAGLLRGETFCEGGSKPPQGETAARSLAAEARATQSSSSSAAVTRPSWTASVWSQGSGLARRGPIASAGRGDREAPGGAGEGVGLRLGLHEGGTRCCRRSGGPGLDLLFSGGSPELADAGDRSLRCQWASPCLEGCRRRR